MTVIRARRTSWLISVKVGQLSGALTTRSRARRPKSESEAFPRRSPSGSSTGSSRTPLRSVLCLFAAAFLLGGCGGSTPEQTAHEPRLPAALGSKLAAQADAVAKEVRERDFERARERAQALERDVRRAIADGRVPEALRAPLLAAVNDLLRSIAQAERAAGEDAGEGEDEGKGKGKDKEKKEKDEEEDEEGEDSSSAGDDTTSATETTEEQATTEEQTTVEQQTTTDAPGNSENAPGQGKGKDKAGSSEVDE